MNREEILARADELVKQKGWTRAFALSIMLSASSNADERELIFKLMHAESAKGTLDDLFKA